MVYLDKVFKFITKIIKFDFNKSIIKIMKHGIRFSFILMLIATYILYIYKSINNFEIFYIGISIFKSSLFFLVSFIIFGLSFNKIVKEML